MSHHPAIEINKSQTNSIENPKETQLKWKLTESFFFHSYNFFFILLMKKEERKKGKRVGDLIFTENILHKEKKRLNKCNLTFLLKNLSIKHNKC